MNEDRERPRAFGRDGYVREGLADARRDGLPAVFKVLGIIGAVFVAYFVIRWAATEYYITTHCTEVLGTRVCQ